MANWDDQVECPNCKQGSLIFVQPKGTDHTLVKSIKDGKVEIHEDATCTSIADAPYLNCMECNLIMSPETYEVMVAGTQEQEVANG